MSTPHLVDTNIVLRWINQNHPAHLVTDHAVERLVNAGHPLCVTAQNLIEFWNVSTRPADRNGFGLTPARTDIAMDRILDFFDFLPDNTRIFDEWRRAVQENGVSGVAVHDARLVAVMRVYGISRILTFNGPDFRRYDGIEAVHPNDLATAP